jgi:hypothetical protein
MTARVTALRGLVGSLLLSTVPFDTGYGADEKIPNFAANMNTGWVIDRNQPGFSDDLLPIPGSGPGPVTFDPAHPYYPNGTPGHPPTYRVADLSNPILQPWAREAMKKPNEEVIAGKVPFRARERCWPVGVPGWDNYSLVEPYYFYQMPDHVTVINLAGPGIRRIYLNVPHSKTVKPSWYGESIGHYENGDTLVIDTIGISPKSFVDNYRTPHTDQLHVIERWQLVDGGKAVEVTVNVEDPGAFTTPWSARQRWRLFGQPVTENPCAENNGDFFNHDLIPIPQAAKPDF